MNGHGGEEPGPGRLWYASFGSMMNSTALRLRGIVPLQSVWCEIPGYRRIFYAVSGVATLEPENGAVTHCVAHDITEDELAKLQSREPPAVWVKARLRPPGESARETTVVSYIARGVALEGLNVSVRGKAGDFVKQSGSGAIGQLSCAVRPGEVPVVLLWQQAFDAAGPVTIDGTLAGTPSRVCDTRLTQALPTARYVALMVEGAASVGMDAALLESLAELPCIPRKEKHQLGVFPIDASVEQRPYTKDEVIKQSDCIIFREKILRGPGSCFTWAPGTDVGLWFSRQFYDPKYGLPPESSTEPWDGWPAIEDRALEIHLQEFVQIGWLAPERS